MTKYLSLDNSPNIPADKANALQSGLERILETDLKGNMFSMLAGYQRILADNKKRNQWVEVHQKLEILFLAGKAAALDGPMIGIPVSIRDSDYFREVSGLLGKSRSAVAKLEWMATSWNATFADTGLWMGKTFEPVEKEVVARVTKNDQDIIDSYDPLTTRIGRNFFRNPPEPNPIQSIGLPGLSVLWNLQERPTLEKPNIFDTRLLPENAVKEEHIPYTMTGGIFLSGMGQSVVPEMNKKLVYQLNYRWPELRPVYPMTRLIDEVVQIGEGIYLGQLVFATKHYGYLTINVGGHARQIGEDYVPQESSGINYGYQNNGYFLMMDPVYADRVYADDAFPQLRPRKGEQGYVEISKCEDNKTPGAVTTNRSRDWHDGWKQDGRLDEKFTTLITELEGGYNDIRELLLDGESVLQMLQRISEEISENTKKEDDIRCFEKLHQLFRAGVAPTIKNGLFCRYKSDAHNVLVDSPAPRDLYGKNDPCTGFDYYHGATLNLHCGFRGTMKSDARGMADDEHVFPSNLADSLASEEVNSPNVLNAVWHSIGKYIFPWAGKSFEKVSGRRLAMLLDESDDLEKRYPQRVAELRSHIASAPHYASVLKNQEHFWVEDGAYANLLNEGAWDGGMSAETKELWIREAESNWMFGTNLQDSRIVAADAIMKAVDMNYQEPDPVLQASSESGPSPFARQGYIFLGTSGRESILPMNSPGTKKKEVFQFQYRFPMIGGPAPIGFCLDEIVEIADGLFLGQLIYATALDLLFHSSVDPAEYKYQLFGYFLLLDDEWQGHRLAIGMDTWKDL